MARPSRTSRPGKTKAPKRSIPPFGRRSHRLTQKAARQARQRYLRRHGEGRDAIAPAAYGRGIFDAILKQKGCVGVRFYPGLNDAGRVTLLFVGVDAEGNDMLGLIGDVPWLCPPFCGGVNGVLQL